jgi:hypothetical protein
VIHRQSAATEASGDAGGFWLFGGTTIRRLDKM